MSWPDSFRGHFSVWVVATPVRARCLSFAGNYLDAQAVLDWGVVLDVVPPDKAQTGDATGAPRVIRHGLNEPHA